MNKQEAMELIKNKTGFDNNTMQFLDYYKYSEPLFIKLAEAIKSNN